MRERALGAGLPNATGSPKLFNFNIGIKKSPLKKIIKEESPVKMLIKKIMKEEKPKLKLMKPKSSLMSIVSFPLKV